MHTNTYVHTPRCPLLSRRRRKDREESALDGLVEE